MNGYYELRYKNERYSFLQPLRKDVICGVGYITLKHVLTGETLTFEQTEIRGFRVTRPIEAASAS